MGCAIFSLKLIPQTVEAEITAVMPSQRACDAENQARYTLSNGPLRVQRNAFYAQSILQRVGIRQLPGDMMVSPPSARVTVNSRWHRGSFVSLVSHSSLTDCTVLSGRFCLRNKLLWQNAKGAFLFRRSLMHILPPLETVKDIAATQQYDVLPLSCEILSDFITPSKRCASSRTCPPTVTCSNPRRRTTAGAATRFGLRPKARDHVH